MVNQDTIIAVSTAPGLSAIGLIRLSGSKAIPITDDLFYGHNLSKSPGGRNYFGLIKNEAKEIIDEVVVSVFKGPKSYTKEDIIEISCHGSPYIIQEIIALFLRQHVRLALPGEFTQRAFLSGRMDLSQAEAVADLIASENKGAHKLAMRQMRGKIKHQIDHLREQLINFASLIELELDFGEEDVEFADRQQLNDLLDKLEKEIKQLIDSFTHGNAIKNGIPTVIAGRPNAGKSTLLNNLLGEERAIVSDIPGTTRDTIEEDLIIEGIKYRLIDTAGLRKAVDVIEDIGIKRTKEKIKDSHLLIYVFDQSQFSESEVRSEVEKIIPDESQLLLIANKADLVESPIESSADLVSISAISSDSIDSIKSKIYSITLPKQGELPDIILTNARHVDAFSKAYKSLQEVKKGLEMGISGDFLAIDIRAALSALGEVTGQVSPDDLLANIFGKFCIGK